MSKKKIVITGTLAVVVLAAGGLAVAARGEPGVEVRTETVQRRDLVSVVTASGYIQPKRKVDISADVSGRVIQLAVEEGQWVERGDLLLRLDPTSYEAAERRARAALAQARAQAAQARANLLQAESEARRAERLAQSQEPLISPSDLEQARTQAAVAEAQHEAALHGVEQAEAALAETREALRKTTIVAPMSGRVTRLNIEEGETAVVGTMNNPGSLLLTVAELDEMEARVEVDETDVPHISVGDSAEVEIDAFPDQRFAGRVTRIGNSAIQAPGQTMGQSSGGQSVDFEVVVALTDPPATLRPDLSATAKIVTDTREAALSVPIIALTVRDREGKRFQLNESEAEARAQAEQGPREELEGVFLLRDGAAEFVPVQVGIAGDRYFEVTDGLAGGETVIAGPYATVRELESGQQVRRPEPAEPPANQTARTQEGTR